MQEAASNEKVRKHSVCVVHSSADLTGAFTAVRRQAALMRDEIDFLLVLPRHHHIPAQELKPFTEIVQLPMPEGPRSVMTAIRILVTLPYMALALRRFLMKRNCHRVQFNGFTPPYAPFLRLVGFGGRIVTWIRIDPARLRTGGRLSLRLAAFGSDAIVVVSKHVCGALPSWDETVLIYDPVEESPLIGASDEPALVVLGSYVPIKGHQIAIAAFHRLALRHPRARLIFHGNRAGTNGSADYYAALQRAADNGPAASRIEFRDFVPIVEALTGKRAVVAPSVSESFSLACQDAAAHGLPVIATRSGGPQELIDESETGYLVDVGDINALADRMDRLLSDVALARSMGARASELIRQRFCAERFKQQFREVFAL